MRPALAVLAKTRGERAETRRLWKMVLDACPGDPEAMTRGSLLAFPLKKTFNILANNVAGSPQSLGNRNASFTRSR